MTIKCHIIKHLKHSKITINVCLQKKKNQNMAQVLIY